MNKFKVKGIKSVVDALGDFGDSVTEQLEEETDKATINVERGAKKGAPVDTGRLRGSTHRNANGLDGSVFTAVDYAPYLEFGTGSMVDIPEGLESYAAQFKGDGKRNVSIPASPFLFPAWFSERPEYIKRIKKVLGRNAKNFNR